MTELKQTQQEHFAYIASIGGYSHLTEADDVHNGLNQKLIKAFKSTYGTAYLGRINFCGEQREELLAGKRSPIDEYVGQKIYNFSCDFVVPTKDKILENLIREWNKTASVTVLDAIYARVEAFDGTILLWT